MEKLQLWEWEWRIYFIGLTFEPPSCSCCRRLYQWLNRFYTFRLIRRRQTTVNSPKMMDTAIKQYKEAINSTLAGNSVYQRLSVVFLCVSTYPPLLLSVFSFHHVVLSGTQAMTRRLVTTRVSQPRSRPSNDQRPTISSSQCVGDSSPHSHPWDARNPHSPYPFRWWYTGKR